LALVLVVMMVLMVVMVVLVLVMLMVMNVALVLLLLLLLVVEVVLVLGHRVVTVEAWSAIRSLATSLRRMSVGTAAVTRTALTTAVAPVPTAGLASGTGSANNFPIALTLFQVMDGPV